MVLTMRIGIMINTRHHLTAAQEARMFSVRSFLLVNLWLVLLLSAAVHSLLN
jgi:hypothetical protein